MSERMIRAANLKLIRQRDYDSQKALGKALGWTGAYVGRLINRNTPFTEDTAREIEEKLGLPYRWLDEIHETADYDKDDPEYRLATRTKSTSSGQHPPISAEPPPKWEDKQGFTLGGLSEWPDTKMFRVPAVPWGLLEGAVKISNREWPNEGLMQVAPIVPTISDKTKVSEVVESSISTIAPGDRVAVDPGQQPWHDCVVVVTGPGLKHPVLRRYRALANGTDFEAYCQSEPPLDSARHGISIVGVVVGLHKTNF